MSRLTTSRLPWRKERRQVRISNQTTWGQRARRMAGSLVRFVLLIAGICLIWDLVVRAFEISPLVLPPPADVYMALKNGLITQPIEQGLMARQSFYGHLYATVSVSLYGFVIGGLAGIGVGILLAEFEMLRRLVSPLITGFQSLPKIALAPLMVIWFGFGLRPRLFLITVLVFFPVLVSTMSGMRAVERSRLELLSALKATRLQRLWIVKIPSALPFIMSGLEVGIVYSLIGAIVAEFTMAREGMGVLMIGYQVSLATSGMFAVLIVLACVGAVLFGSMRFIDSRVLFWMPREDVDRTTKAEQA